jgi:hypothetical protein
MASRKRAYPHFTPLWGVIKAGSSAPGFFALEEEAYAMATYEPSDREDEYFLRLDAKMIERV